MSSPLRPDAAARPGATESALAARLVAMTSAMRTHGLAVGTSDVADAGRAAESLGLQDRERLRAGLASTLLRRSGERAVFDQVFDLYFPAAMGARSAESPDLPDGDDRELAAALRDHLSDALSRHDADALEELAAMALERLGALERQPGWSAAQALDRLAPQTAIAGALERTRQAGQVRGDGEGGRASASGGGSAGSGSGAGAPRFTDRFARDEFRSGIAEFRRRVETEARRRNAELRGTERIAEYGVRPAVQSRDFLASGSKDLDELRATLHPLAKRLAARLSARRRQQARGEIDVRKTLRRSLSTGGVPIDPAYVHRRPHRPDLVLLCDISGSVAGFSAFTIALMQALTTQFRRLRIFAFVSTTDEITDLVLDADLLADDVLATALRTRKVLGWGASSSYGQALDSFASKYLDAVGPRTTVLVLGDARSNYGLPRLSVLRTIQEQARQVVWLNPEPAASWDTGDSLAGQYAQILDMHECRNVEQLRTFIARTLAV